MLEHIPSYKQLEPGIELLRIQPRNDIARLSRAACELASLDPGFEYEPAFTATFAAYAGKTIKQVVTRLDERYAGPDPLIIGYVVLKGSKPIGQMAISRVGTAWLNAAGEQKELEHGANFGQWYAAEARGQGIGTKVSQFRLGVMASAFGAVGTSWEGRTPWTAIRPENTASVKIIKATGLFENVGVSVQHVGTAPEMQRDIWVAK